MNFTPRFVIEDDDPAMRGRFTKWMVEVVKHAAYDYLRRHENQQQNTYGLTPPDHAGCENQTPASDGFDFEEERLSQAFSGLSLLRRRILTLTFVEGLTAQETADRLGCKVEDVYLQKHRVIKKLRDLLMEGGGEHGK